MYQFYHPQQYLRKGNDFTPVCDSVHGMGGGPPAVLGGGGHPPGQTPPR